MKLLKWLFILLMAFVTVIIIAIFSDLFLPVTRGLPGHFYGQSALDAEQDSIRCYDLAKRTSTVLVDDTRIFFGHITVWDVSHNNTRFAAAYHGSDNKGYVRWYAIRNGKLVVQPEKANSMVVPGVVVGLSLTPDGQICAVRYEVRSGDENEQFTEFWDLERKKKLDISVDTFGLSDAPIWDASGRWFTYLNKWGHVVLYDMKLKTAKILPDIGGGIYFGGVCPISPDAKLVWVHIYGTDRAYLRNLLDHSVVNLNNDSSPDNWSPDSEGFLYHSDNYLWPALLYYDIKSGRSYRMPVSTISYQTRWVR